MTFLDFRLLHETDLMFALGDVCSSGAGENRKTYARIGLFRV
jgi:hypothetical protein